MKYSQKFWMTILCLALFVSGLSLGVQIGIDTQDKEFRKAFGMSEIKFE